MSGRGGARASEGPKDTENMKMMSLLENVEMLDKLDRWLRTGVFRRHYDVNEITIRYIKKDKDRIRWSIKVSAAIKWENLLRKALWHLPEKIERSTDHMAGAKYPEQFRKVIEERNFLTTVSH